MNTGTHRSEFAYDGLQHRTEIIEKENGVTQTDTTVIWCQAFICEERAADGVTVTRRAFAQGEQVAGVPHYFTADHLGSVAGVTDNTSTLLASYAFDPWGRRTQTAGAGATNVGFTGHQWNEASGLSFTLYRAFDADLGRWLSEDKLGPLAPGGTNVFAYVMNRPVVLIDPIGLDGLPPSNSPKTSLPPPPTPPGCTKVGLAFVCSPPPPPPPPSMCAEPPRRCTPYVDKGLYWACILFRAGSFTTWGPIPPGGPLGSAAGLAMDCTQYATRCLEGGPPPQFPDISMR